MGNEGGGCPVARCIVGSARVVLLRLLIKVDKWLGLELKCALLRPEAAWSTIKQVFGQYCYVHISYFSLVYPTAQGQNFKPEKRPLKNLRSEQVSRLQGEQPCSTWYISSPNICQCRILLPLTSWLLSSCTLSVL